MSYKAILMELVRTALNYPDGELQELVSKPDTELTDDDDKTIADKLKGHYRNVLTQINVTNNKALDEKFKAGQRSKAQEFESTLKEVFNVNSDKQGSELISEIRDSLNSKQADKTKDKLTDDDVKRHPAYIKAETEFQAQMKKLNEEREAEINSLKQETQRKEVFGEVSKTGLDTFLSMNPVLSSDAAKAQAQQNLIVEKLGAYDWQKVDNKYMPLYKDGDNKGKRVENEFGHAMDLNDLVKQVSSNYFDFKVATERNAPNGSQNQSNQNQSAAKSTYAGKMPVSESEYQSLMSNRNLSITDRKAINEHWEKNQPQNA